ncbi:MAG: cation:proton antiporter [Elusimicrobia bacterium CG1_02_37_114]|nr:MAG: cation:proton antiporter [Elusimicrobia bacterium CG1_02_37_114]PIV52797.1 MAG: cation:proton antiporter [Elusimicrobia bacterium CG02_land_8_20_14_3_00_37_13]
MTEYFLCWILFCVGLYCVLTKRNLIKIIIGLGIMEYAVNLFFILLGYKKDGVFPILSKTLETKPEMMVDPLPQALILTSIVIGLATTCLLVSLAMHIYEKYGTYDVRELRKLKG